MKYLATATYREAGDHNRLKTKLHYVEADDSNEARTMVEIRLRNQGIAFLLVKVCEFPSAPQHMEELIS